MIDLPGLHARIFLSTGFFQQQKHGIQLYLRRPAIEPIHPLPTGRDGAYLRLRKHYPMQPPRRFALNLILALLTTLTACDGDNSGNDGPGIDLGDPSTLVGTYDLESFKDVSGDRFDVPGLEFEAGEDLEFDFEGVSFTVSIDGTLVLTASRYTMVTEFTLRLTGFPTESETDSDTGTYSLSGSTFTIDSEDPDSEGTEVLTASVSGRRLMLEDEEVRLTFRQR